MANDTKKGHKDSSIKKRLISINEAALYLGRTPHAVRHLVRNGNIPYVRVGTKRISIDLYDLERLVKKNKFCEEKKDSQITPRDDI